MIEDLEEQVELLERDVEILHQVAAHRPIGIQKLADRTDYLHHQVRYSLRVLEDEGIIDATDQGAIITDQAADILSEYEEQKTTLIERLETVKLGTHTENS